MRKLSNIFLTLSIVFFIMWLLFRWHYYQSFTRDEIEAAFEPITSKYGIKIVYDVRGDFFTPMKNPVGPAGPHLDSKVKPICHRVLMRYPGILQKAFSKYPESVIKSSLDAIYFADEIDHNGRIYGGTYDVYRRIIYLVDNGAKNDCQAMGTFHHEFSSILMRSHPFWTKLWIDHNPKGFKYFDDIYDTWKEVDEASEAFAIEACYEKGFVTDYGLTNLENDFNEYSRMIFAYPQKFKKAMDQYSRVRGKFMVWLEFYHKIDPIFTEEYLFGKGGKADK